MSTLAETQQSIAGSVGMRTSSSSSGRSGEQKRMSSEGNDESSRRSSRDENSPPAKRRLSSILPKSSKRWIQKLRSRDSAPPIRGLDTTSAPVSNSIAAQVIVQRLDDWRKDSSGPSCALLVGAPGVGKTALARRWAQGLSDSVLAHTWAVTGARGEAASWVKEAIDGITRLVKNSHNTVIPKPLIPPGAAETAGTASWALVLAALKSVSATDSLPSGSCVIIVDAADGPLAAPEATEVIRAIIGGLELLPHWLRLLVVSRGDALVMRPLLRAPESSVGLIRLTTTWDDGYDADSPVWEAMARRLWGSPPSSPSSSSSVLTNGASDLQRSVSAPALNNPRSSMDSGPPNSARSGNSTSSSTASSTTSSSVSSPTAAPVAGSVAAPRPLRKRSSLLNLSGVFGDSLRSLRPTSPPLGGSRPTSPVLPRAQVAPPPAALPDIAPVLSCLIAIGSHPIPQLMIESALQRPIGGALTVLSSVVTASDEGLRLVSSGFAEWATAHVPGISKDESAALLASEVVKEWQFGDKNKAWAANEAVHMATITTDERAQREIHEHIIMDWDWALTQLVRPKIEGGPGDFDLSIELLDDGRPFDGGAEKLIQSLKKLEKAGWVGGMSEVTVLRRAWNRWSAMQPSSLDEIADALGSAFARVASEGASTLRRGLGMIRPLLEAGRVGVTYSGIRNVDQVIFGARDSVVTSLAAGPAGALLIGQASGEIVMVDVDRSRPLARALMLGHEGVVHSMQLMPDMRHVVSGGDDGTVRLWSLEDGVCQAIMEGHLGEVLDVCVMDNETVASAGQDFSVRVWKKSSEPSEESWVCTPMSEAHDQPATTVTALGNRNGQLMSGSEDTSLRIWDPDTGACLCILHDHEEAVTCTAVLSNNQLVSGSADGHVRIWRSSWYHSEMIDHPETTLYGHKAAITALVVGDDGRRVISGDATGEIRVWNTSSSSGSCERLLHAHSTSIVSLTVLTDGRVASAAENDSRVIVWAMDGLHDSLGEGHSEEVMSLCFLPDGRVVTGSDDMYCRIWAQPTDLERGRRIALESIVEGHEGGIECVAAVPSEFAGPARFVSGSEDTTLRVWVEDTPGYWRREHLLVGHVAYVMCVTTVDQGRWIVSGSADNNVRVWDAQYGTKEFNLTGHTDSVLEVAPLRSGQAVSCSRDGTVRLWDILAGECLGIFSGAEEAVTGLTVIDRGLTVLGGCYDGSLVTWKMTDAAVAAASDDEASPQNMNVVFDGPVYPMVVVDEAAGLVLVGGKEPVLRLWNWKRRVVVGEMRVPCDVHTLTYDDVRSVVLVGQATGWLALRFTGTGLTPLPDLPEEEPSDDSDNQADNESPGDDVVETRSSSSGRSSTSSDAGGPRPVPSWRGLDAGDSSSSDEGSVIQHGDVDSDDSDAGSVNQHDDPGLGGREDNEMTQEDVDRLGRAKLDSSSDDGNYNSDD